MAHDASFQLLRRPPGFGALLGGLLLFWLSLSPSLLPRPILLQAAVSGLALAVGYWLGCVAAWLVRRVAPRPLRPSVRRVAWWALGGVAAVSIPLVVVLGARWQASVRELMALPRPPGLLWAAVPLLAAVLAGLLVVAARLLRLLAVAMLALVGRVASTRPPMVRRAGVTALVAAVLVPGIVLDPMGMALREAFLLGNGRTSPGVERPGSPLRSGGPGSLVSWEGLGYKGRDFVAAGPTAADIAALSGRAAREPVRVYVGVEAADTLAERVDLALAELDRTGAWGRRVLTILTATGTGWVDEQAAQPLEYLHDGDTALVALQYSYLPSWLSFNVEPELAARASAALIGAVHERWSALPEQTRPTLLLFGESLGSLGVESAFGGLDELLAMTDGALLVGPVFRNPIRARLTAEREPTSPPWLPVYDAGRHVRFAVCPTDLSRPATPWLAPRVVYLQNASDPVAYWEPQLLWRRPAWLQEPRGPDVSPSLRWLPVVTFWQVSVDMTHSTRGLPAGHGHVYGPNLVDAWAAVHPPRGWSDDDLAALREVVSRAETRPLPQRQPAAPGTDSGGCTDGAGGPGAGGPGEPGAQRPGAGEPSAGGSGAAAQGAKDSLIVASTGRMM